jgi:alkylhydroperoxidase family enzyme
MSQPSAKRFPTPALDKLPEDIRDRILAVQEKSGFVPNVFLTLAYRPDEFRAFFAYHDALMDKDGRLTKSPSTTARRISRRGNGRCSISP